MHGCQSAPPKAKDEVYDVAIIGGGVVGCAILRQLTLAGYKAIVLEREANLFEWASGSNSGIICTGVDAPADSLERALIRDSISRIRPFLRQMNIPHEECGSLVCEWTWDKNDEDRSHGDLHDNRLEAVHKESHDAGDTQVRMLSFDELRRLEPNLRHDQNRGAIHIPGEILVDPWLYSIALAVHARENGAAILTNFEVDTSATLFDGQCWIIRNKLCNNSCPSAVQANVIVNAAGLWSDEIQRETLNKTAVPWAAQPRRGQYRIYQARHNTQIRHPIQPIPTSRTKGVFVFGTLYNQIVVGPTALDQDSKTDRSVDKEVANELDAHACRIVPHLQPETDCVGEYVGLRPGTNHRDYQFYVDVAQRWIAAAGVRSTGLTASLGVGRHVCNLIQTCLPIPPTQTDLVANKTTTTPLPPISDLIRDFERRGDGTVEIRGYVYKVTHPITRLGWLPLEEVKIQK